MKKRLLCLGLILALVFSFAACTNELKPDDNQGDPPSQGELIPGPNYNPGDPPSKEPSSDPFAYVPCKLLYWEISPSVDADTQLQERVFSMSELQSSIEYQRNAAPFEEFDSDFFEEKSLLVFRFKAPYLGGQALLSYAYTLDNGDSITVNAWYHCGLDPDAGSVLMLAQLDRDEYTDISVHVSYANFEFTDSDVIIWLTKEATYATIFHDYTVEDFPELNAVAVEEITIYTNARIRQCLLEDPTGGTIPDHLKNLKRCFMIKLTEKSKENVLRAVNILLQRDDIEVAGPNYLYHAEDD